MNVVRPSRDRALSVAGGGIRKLRTELRSLQPASVTFLGAPIRREGQEGAQSITYLDDQRGLELWSALRSDSAPSYASRHQDQLHAPAVLHPEPRRPLRRRS
jgi:hypothetical protein